MLITVCNYIQMVYLTVTSDFAAESCEVGGEGEEFPRG